MNVNKNKKTIRTKSNASNSKKYKKEYSRYNNRKGKLKLYANYDILEDKEIERMYSWRRFLIPAVVILPNIMILKNLIDTSHDILDKYKVEQVADSTKKENKNEVIDFFKEVVKWQMSRYEGGYSDDPRDSGNYYKGDLWGTNHGISADFAGRIGLTKEKLKDLTIDEAADILVDYASDKLNTNPDTTSKDFIVIYSLYNFYYGKERAYIPLVDYFGLSRTKYDAEKALSEGILDKSVAEHLKKYFEQLLLKSFINDLNRTIPLYSFGWYRRYVETLEHWKKKGYTELEPSSEFLEQAADILNQIKEKQALAKKAQTEQEVQQEQQSDTLKQIDEQELSPQNLSLKETLQQELSLQDPSTQEIALHDELTQESSSIDRDNTEYTKGKTKSRKGKSKRFSKGYNA